MAPGTSFIANILPQEGKSQFEAMFVSWFDIEQYTLAFDSDKEKWDFAEWLYQNRDNENTDSEREECGKYLWSLWEKVLRSKLSIGT